MHLIVHKKRHDRVVDWLDARLTLIFFVIMIVFFLGVATNTYAFSVQRHLDDQKLLLRDDASAIQQAMIDQQTSLREYISSNNSLYLSPFQQGRSAYTSSVQDITNQLRSSPFQHTLVGLTVLQEVANDWYNTYAIVQINEMQAGKIAGPRSEGSLLQGNALFDQFRASITQLQKTIEQDLAGYQNQVDTINLSLIFAILVLAIVVNSAFLLMLRNFTKRLQTQILSITSTTDLLGQGEQSARVAPLPFTDLDHVGQSINHMAGAIEESRRVLQHQYALVERSESESRAVFEASSEAFLFISADGQVHALNRLFREFFALPAEGVVGMPFDDLQPQWEALLFNADSFHRDLVQDRTNQERCYTTIVIQKEPQCREFALSSTPVPSSTNTYLGRLYVLRDITQEREVERLKTEFNTLVTHGLRSPLTSIKGYTDLLVEQDETGHLTDLQQEFLEIVQSNTRRLLALVNDLLDMSRLEAQIMVIHPVPLDLHTLIHDVILDMRPQIEERHQRLSLHLASMRLIVQGDENRVGQILTNLLTFSINHTPVGGRIIWQTQLEETMVRVTCSSSGVLSAEDMDAFTHPFLHASAFSSSATMGSVLGPPITRSLVELHGGTLQMSMKEEEGCTITFTLPYSSHQASVREAVAHM